MADILRITLPIYFIIYFGVAIILKSLVVAKRIGKNPFVVPNEDSIYELVGFYFKLTLSTIFIYVVVYALFPTWHPNFLTIVQLTNPTICCIGISLMFISLIWTVIAQTQMKNSWRIGIDTEAKTELVTNGLFENPYFSTWI